MNIWDTIFPLLRAAFLRDDPALSAVADHECEAFSERTGIPLPDGIRAWLRILNGGYTGAGELLGINPGREDLNIESTYEAFPVWKAKGWIPIASDRFGNYYVVPTRQEYGAGFPVLFVDTMHSLHEPAYIVASNMEHFLPYFLEDALGVHVFVFSKDYFLERDPKLRDYTNVPFIWEKK